MRKRLPIRERRAQPVQAYVTLNDRKQMEQLARDRDVTVSMLVVSLIRKELESAS